MSESQAALDLQVDMTRGVVDILDDVTANDLLIRTTALDLREKLKSMPFWHKTVASNATLGIHMAQLANKSTATNDELLEVIALASMMRLRSKVYGAEA